MKRLAIVVLSLFVVLPAVAHPGSGIVAHRGQVYFVDTGSGVYKLDAKDGPVKVPGPAFHWMAIDPDNRFAKTTLPSGSDWEIARGGASPTILLASDFPIAIGKDGNLYYPASIGRAGVEIRKLTPAGATSVLARLPVAWVNGLAAGPDGSLYFSEDRSIRRIDKAGHVATVIPEATSAGCASFPGNDPEDGPYFRGLDVDAEGSVVVAAAGCGSVFKITPRGKITKLVQLEAPWSPTAVVHVGSDVYVLEYLHVAGDDRRLWIPRVRKISPDGKSVVVATIKRS